MKLEQVRAIAEAVMYEGYILYPYRHNALKNRIRWTIGVVYPRAYSEAQGGIDPWQMHTECLIEGSPMTHLSVTSRFLHLLDCLNSNESDTWQEGMEREVQAPTLTLHALSESPRSVRINFAGTHLPADTSGIVRTMQALQGELAIGCSQLGANLFKLTIDIANTTPNTAEIDSRHEAILRHAFISIHTIMHIKDGSFVSLLEYPEALREQVENCRNIRTWPVLVGKQGERDCMLSAPIILYDYPQIAPESPGAFFDGTEIDELLTLRILTLSDEEKEAMRQGGESTRKLLERVEAMSPEQLMRLHGTLRDWQASDEARNDSTGQNGSIFPGEDYPPPQGIRIANHNVRKGDRVRLHPRLRADAFDMLLEGKIGRVECIQQDFENRLYLVVTLDDDPGREQWDERVLPGHRFFFAPEEIEPLGRVSL
ncbi:hypothetical protein [Ktedonospora formicarum]|uniref:Uncharacterized protein n=1 Tax=Ktedonospora formicarum TaxID=2778364 RepID=A0A8J3HRL1_9CHLR|nr:hypothetical protein [Ktedonospora formicarum]GHO42587.1 hypothetical protein KSX_07500 [Ktedonospora formicarum]